MEIIQINGKKYRCYEYVDVNYGAEEINNTLDYLREVLKELDNDITLKDVSYRLVVYEEDEIDAFVKRIDSEYLLGISIGTFVNLRNWFNMCFCNDKTYDVFRLNNDKREYYFKYTYRKALEFLVIHEYTHMKDGHCDSPENEQKLIFEQSKTISSEEALFSQTLEYDADSWSASHCAFKIINENLTDEEKNENLKLLMFSIYTIFKKFSEYDKYDFVTFMKEDLLKHTHPMAEIRYRYVGATIFTNIMKTAQEHRAILEKNVVEGVTNFEIQVLGVNDLTKRLYALAYTPKGTKHLVLLHNSWNEVADKLKEYAHDKLFRVTPMGKEAENLFSFDENGNIV